MAGIFYEIFYVYHDFFHKYKSFSVHSESNNTQNSYDCTFTAFLLTFIYQVGVPVEGIINRHDILWQKTFELFQALLHTKLKYPASDVQYFKTYSPVNSININLRWAPGFPTKLFKCSKPCSPAINTLVHEYWGYSKWQTLDFISRRV